MAFFRPGRYNGKKEKRKGRLSIRYVYRPYHPWRHGYRREKWKKAFLLLVKILFVAEAAALAGSYIKENTAVTVTERSVDAFPGGEGREDDVYGIGIGTGDGSVFWFHKDSEVLESGKE